MELKFMTPMEVWDSYVPNAAPLENSIISVDTNDNVVCSKQYFTAEEAKDGRLRAFAEIYSDSRWADARAAILLLPTFRRPDSDDLIRYLVREGYVVCLLDYCGAVSEVEEKTTFPASLSFAEFPTCKDYLHHIDGDARHTPWFVWSKIARRAICLLEQQRIVDKTHIGIIGIGEGAHTAWQVAATDKRIGALVSVGESGYRWARHKPRYTFGNVPSSDEDRAFMAGVGAETYAKGINCPTFILASRTSNYADVDRVGDLFATVKTQNKQLLITHGRETQITQTALKVLTNWLRQCFILGETDKALSPALSAVNIDNKLYLRVDPTSETEFDRIYVCYGETSAVARHWELFDELQKVDKNTFAVRVPVYDKDEIIVAYATCAYKNDDIASSPVIALIPSKMGITATESRNESSRIIYDGSMELGSFECRTEETILPDDILHQAEGPFGIKGISAKKGGLYLCRDAAEFATLRRTSTLHFDVYSPTARTLDIHMYAFPEMKKYTAHTSLDGGEFWQKVLLQRDDFKSKEGKTLAKFADTKILFLSDVGGLVFNNFLWI